MGFRHSKQQQLKNNLKFHTFLPVKYVNLDFDGLGRYRVKLISVKSEISLFQGINANEEKQSERVILRLCLSFLSTWAAQALTAVSGVTNNAPYECQ